jgi:hypothetical protein
MRGYPMNLMLAALVLLSSFVIAQGAAQTHPPISYKSALAAEQAKTPLLRDFKRVPRLHVPAHQIDKAKFFKHQDRIMFGTDNGLAPRQGRFEISSLSLPDPVLEKIYRKKAERLFSQFKSHTVSKRAK